MERPAHDEISSLVHIIVSYKWPIEYESMNFDNICPNPDSIQFKLDLTKLPFSLFL